MAVYKEGSWNHSMLTSLEECVERLDYNSPELCLLDDCACVCSLLSQRKCDVARVGREYSFNRAGNEHIPCQPASQTSVATTRALNFGGLAS